MANVFSRFSKEREPMCRASLPGRRASSRRAGRLLICSILTFALLLSVTACKKKRFKERSDIDLSSFDACPVELTVDVVWNRKVNVTLTNKGDASYTYGSEYRLEYRQSGEWYKVPFLPHVGFTLIGYTLGHGEPVTSGDEEYAISNTAEMTYYLDEMHGDLPAGHYRILSELFPESSSSTQYWIAGEFDLERATSEAEPLRKSRVDPAQVVPTDEHTLRITSVDYNREENTLVIMYARSVDFILEMQQDGQWYEIPVRGYGGSYDATAIDQQIDMHLEQELTSGHYRLIRDDYLQGDEQEDSTSRYLIYEFDL